MRLALYVSAAWLVLGWVVAILVCRVIRARDAHERLAQDAGFPSEGPGWDGPDCNCRPQPVVPAFRFGSGPLAGVGLHTSRPWVQR